MKIEITIPTSLSEIPLCRYQEFVKVRTDSNDEELVAFKMISLLCDVKLEDVSKMTLKSINELIIHLTKLFEEKPKFKTTFTLGGMEFGFINDLENISYGEYIELEKYLSDWTTYHKAMAVMYRPITSKFKNKYEIAEHKTMPEMQDVMKFVPLDIAMSSSVFFWNLGQELLVATLSYLETEILTSKELTMSLAHELNLENGGDGIRQYMQSLRETSHASMTLPSSDYLSVSTF